MSTAPNRAMPNQAANREKILAARGNLEANETPDYFSSRQDNPPHAEHATGSPFEDDGR